MIDDGHDQKLAVAKDADHNVESPVQRPRGPVAHRRAPVTRADQQQQVGVGRGDQVDDRRRTLLARPAGRQPEIDNPAVREQRGRPCILLQRVPVEPLAGVVHGPFVKTLGLGGMDDLIPALLDDERLSAGNQVGRRQ